MAPEARQDPAALMQALSTEPWRFDFFQAVRLLECLHDSAPRVGRSKMLREDTVRFGQLLSLACAPSSLAAPQNERRPQKITVEFTGLTGPHGPMPLRLTEFIRNRLRGIQDPDAPQFESDSSEKSGSIAPKDSTLAEFLDLFHHRMIALFYRAWAVAQKSVDFDRAEDRSFAEWTASLAGLGLPELDGQDSIPTWEKLPFTGHLACQTRHPGGLEGILKATFSTPAKIYSFTGHWINLPEQERCKLGDRNRPGTLGRSCVVGTRMWDRNLKFTVHLGPISLQQFSAFLPGSACHRRLHDWIDFYTSKQYYWKAVILLKKEEVPKICLGRCGQLGYNSWLGSLPFTHDPGDYQVRGGGLTAAENS